MKEIGVYKYNIRTKELIKEILDFANNNKDNVFLNYYVSKDNDNRGFLFNVDRITIFLYYLEKDLRNDIEENEILGHNWCDVDMYDFDDCDINKLKETTYTTKNLLNTILLINKSFNRVLNDYER